jgi:hypothetical protein
MIVPANPPAALAIVVSVETGLASQETGHLAPGVPVCADMPRGALNVGNVRSAVRQAAARLDRPDD